MFLQPATSITSSPSQLAIMTASLQFNLKATYTASDATQTFTHPISIPSSADPLTAKRAHLTTLQSLVPKLQDEINTLLTERMEEDKKAQGAVSEQEVKEEENYGEEVVEDDV